MSRLPPDPCHQPAGKKIAKDPTMLHSWYIANTSTQGTPRRWLWPAVVVGTRARPPTISAPRCVFTPEGMRRRKCSGRTHQRHVGHADLHPGLIAPGMAADADVAAVVDPEERLPRIVVGSVTARALYQCGRPAGDGGGLPAGRREVHAGAGCGGAPGDPQRHPRGGGHFHPGAGAGHRGPDRAVTARTRCAWRYAGWSSATRRPGCDRSTPPAAATSVAW